MITTYNYEKQSYYKKNTNNHPKFKWILFSLYPLFLECIVELNTYHL
jgi:hypothetical protein